MNVFLNFMHGALPWLTVGFLILFFLVKHTKQKKTDAAGDYSGEGMCFGLCLGTALGSDTGIGISLGILIGLVIGSLIKKKPDGAEAQK